MFLRRRQFGAVAAATLAMPWVASAQTNAQNAHLARLYEAAKKEGELTWYTVPQTSEVAEKMGRTFSARYPGVKVNVVRTTAQVAFQRLNQDLKAGSANCDVFTSTDLAHYVDLKGRKLIIQHRPEAVPRSRDCRAGDCGNRRSLGRGRGARAGGGVDERSRIAGRASHARGE